MARPKVPDDKRQRTAQACTICKRRKQKCNGKTPCNTCVKRHLICEYTPHSSSHKSVDNDNGSPTKRRHTDEGRVRRPSSEVAEPPLTPNFLLPAPLPAPRTEAFEFANTEERSISLTVLEGPDRSDSNPKPPSEPEPDEEAHVYHQSRMLQDPTGRLLYIGDSATLSYLQLIRMIVEYSDGPSPFTQDPNRHKIMEATARSGPQDGTLQLLPDKETAFVLAHSYLTNTSGLVQVFDRGELWRSLDSYYRNPLTIEPQPLCLIHLIMAIGLVMATPAAGSKEARIIARLRRDSVDWADLFFRSAKRLGDPLNGFEDADFWSVQALCLMSIYALAVSKRNAAYVYYGMAVRSAFALGLHRAKDTSIIFSPQQVVVRQNLWRSLYVLDRFLAASLGRPLAISEDCSDNSLDCPHTQEMGSSGALSRARGLGAAVSTCQSIGQILMRIYSKRKVTTNLAQKIAGECRLWTKDIHKDMDTQKPFDRRNPSTENIAILHVQLLGWHSTILLTRPFFLYHLSKTQRSQETQCVKPFARIRSRIEKFSEACLSASIHTVSLVHAAYELEFVPQRNPFILYFLFAASLIILSNEFACLFRHDEYDDLVSKAIEVIEYCAKSDPQANRLVFILTTFRAVIQERAQPSAMCDRARSLQTDSSQGCFADHMADLASGPAATPQILIDMQSNTAQFSIPTRSNAAAYVANSDQAHSVAPNPVQGDAAPPDYVRGTSASSSASGRTVSTQQRHSQFGQAGAERDFSESASGEHEVNFDSFWKMGYGSPPTQQQALPRSLVGISNYSSASLTRSNGYAHNSWSDGLPVAGGTIHPPLPLYSISNLPTTKGGAYQ